jgi:hypothetical protein
MRAAAQQQPSSARLQTLEGCGLVISHYPGFRYNATGGGALGHVEALVDGRQALIFPADQVQIPPLSSRTGRFLGLPLPPGLQINIEPERLDGHLDPSNGHIELHFLARFRLQLQLAGRRLYSAPPLLVDTRLSTAAVSSHRHQINGRPLSMDSRGRLVGVAMVPTSGEPWLDRFLGLPDEALAVLDFELRLT